MVEGTVSVGVLPVIWPAVAIGVHGQAVGAEGYVVKSDIDYGICFPPLVGRNREVIQTDVGGPGAARIEEVRGRAARGKVEMAERARVEGEDQVRNIMRRAGVQPRSICGVTVVICVRIIATPT